MLSEVPEAWSESKLEDVCEILDKFRVPLNSDERQMRRGNVPYWGANGIVDYIDEAIFDEPLLLMPEDGGPFGEARIKPICHKIDEPVWVNNHAHVLRVVGASREYVYQWYVNRDITDFLVGGTRAKLNQKALRALPILLPPLNEQHRIAEILSSVDASIQATQAVIEQAERVKRGLMEELLTGGLGSEAIERGEVPEGWKSSSIGALTELQNGYGFKSKDWAQDGLPIIRIQNLNGGGDFNYFNGEYDEKYLVQKGDLLFCWSGSRGTSFGARYWTQEKGLLNQHIFKCIPKQGVEKAFLYYLLDWMTVAIEKEAHGGAGLAHIKKSEMIAFFCCIPPISEQRRIAEILSDSDDFIAKQKSIVEQQARTKRGLMDDLLTGKVRTV